MQLHNPGVQDACLQALKNDPSFSKLLEEPAGDMDIPMQNFSLLPIAAQQAAEVGNLPFKQMQFSALTKQINKLKDYWPDAMNTIAGLKKI